MNGCYLGYVEVVDLDRHSSIGKLFSLDVLLCDMTSVTFQALFPQSLSNLYDSRLKDFMASLLCCDILKLGISQKGTSRLC